jgi:thiamine pyrophosphokinase
MKIKFNKPAILVGGGDIDKNLLKELISKGYPLMAADGGANCLKEWNLLPDFIIGDLDSLKDRAFFEGNTEIIQIKDQDSTDLEKCLGIVSASKFFALGFIGSRFDHSLEILHVFEKFRNKKLLFFSKDDAIFHLPKDFKIELPIGTRISLYPLSPTKFISSEGLKYPLNGLELKQGKLIGTSNENINKLVKIKHDYGLTIGLIPKIFYKSVLN